MSAKEISVTELVPDDRNMNKGNAYGESLIEKSFQKFGAGRSILIDKNNNIIAGNKSTQKFVESGGEKVIVIETDGKSLVAVKRNDIDINTPEGRELALADNASAKANIEWDIPQIELIADEFNIQPQDWGVEISIPEKLIEQEENKIISIKLSINDESEFHPLFNEIKEITAKYISVNITLSGGEL